jgi:hypothetical protein
MKTLNTFTNFLRGEARRKRETAAEGVWTEKLTDAALYEADEIEKVIIPTFEQFTQEYNEWYREHEQEMLSTILQQKNIIKKLEETIEKLK